MRDYPIFDDADEDARQNVYSQLLRHTYERTPAVQRIDPEGKRFCVDVSTLIGGDSRELEFTAVGCHGTATAAFRRREAVSQLPSILARKILGRQRKVGLGLMQWHAAKRRARTPSFGFLLGDNFYESGLPTTDVAMVDGMFDEGYYQVYNVLEGRALGIPYFGLLGNHDYNLHDHAIVPSESSRMASSTKRALAEVDYTYRVGTHWHMPHRYYCVLSEVADFFVIDSTTFLSDAKQQEWLRSLYAQLATNDKWKFLMAHHGFVTFGKRGGAPSGDIHRHLFRWFVREDLHFHFNVVAHDHFTASALLTHGVSDRGHRRTRYVLAGGGGAALSGESPDALVRLGPQLASLDLIERKHGFAVFKVNRDEVQLNYRLLDGARWKDAWQQPVRLERARRDSIDSWSDVGP